MGRRLLNMKRLVFLIAVLFVWTGNPVLSPLQARAQDGYVEDECGECHDAMTEDHQASLHGAMSCLDCHSRAVEIDHFQLPAVNCRQCHAPHDEKTIHDAHIRVSCNACHQKNSVPAIDPTSGKIVSKGRYVPLFSYDPPLSGVHPAPSHQMIAKSDCRNCHFQGNNLGAAAAILPPKSVLCMPCHAAAFSIADRTTLASLAVFLLGMIGVIGLWFSESAVAERPVRRAGGFRRLAFQILADALFLKRLFRLSPARWVIHGLMLYPILFRLIFGLAALILSLILPDAGLTRAMLDKNHPLTGLFFDITGLMILAGVGAAVLRSPEDRQPIPGTPAPGRSMTLLLGCVILAGFILEGMRIAMTGWPAGAGWAFVGYGLSLLMAGMEKLTDAYGYLWYAHAVLTGAFIALIPFTRMLHIITAPLSLMVDIQSHREDKG